MNVSVSQRRWIHQPQTTLEPAEKIKQTLKGDLKIEI